MAVLPILGLRNRSAGGSTLEIGSGFARDATDTVGIGIPADQTRVVDVTATGPGGLDVGTAQPRTSYALYLVEIGGLVSGLLSTSFAAGGVAAPPGAHLRRIGSAFTNDQGRLVGYSQWGTANDRQVSYQRDPKSLAIVRNGTSTVFAPFDLRPVAPISLVSAQLYIVPTAASSTIRASAGSPEFTFTAPALYVFVPPIESTFGEYKSDGAAGRTDIACVGFAEVV